MSAAVSGVTADIPASYKDGEPASVQWRLFLNTLGLRHLCHHGL